MLKLNTEVNELMQIFVLRTDSKTADSILVDMVYDEMTKKLELKRRQGRGGWNGANCDNALLLGMLKDNVEKGDMIDVINLAAMILARQKLYGETA